MPELSTPETMATSAESDLAEAVVKAYTACSHANPLDPSDVIVIKSGGLDLGIGPKLFATRVTISNISGFHSPSEGVTPNFFIEVKKPFGLRPTLLSLIIQEAPGGVSELRPAGNDVLVARPASKAGFVAGLISTGVACGAASLKPR